MDVRRIHFRGAQGATGWKHARLLLQQFVWSTPGATPLQRVGMVVRLALIFVIGLIVLVPLVAVGVALLLVAGIVGGAAYLTAKLARGLPTLRRSDEQGRKNVRVLKQSMPTE